MLIRRPVREVFEAFVDPAITSRFWFTGSTGRLDGGQPVKWEWKMYGISVNVVVKTIEKNERILIDWSVEGHPPTTVEWTFTPRANNTFVVVKNSGFKGDATEQTRQAIDSTEGFAFVLAAAKALLEHDVALNLVADHSPDA